MDKTQAGHPQTDTRTDRKRQTHRRRNRHNDSKMDVSDNVPRQLLQRQNVGVWELTAGGGSHVSFRRTGLYSKHSLRY